MEKYIEENKINAEIIELPSKTHTAEQASRVLKIDIDKIVKSIVLTDGMNGILAILSGNDKISMKKLYNIGRKIYRMASPKEVKLLSGYEIGGVPPIGTRISKTFIDKSLKGMDYVYCGGGSEYHILKIKVNDIEKFSHGAFVDIKV